MKLDWENAFPPKSEDFHNKLVETLNSLPTNREIAIMRKKRYLICVAAMIALLGTISVYAAVKWNERATQHFKADDNMQQKLEEENYSTQEEQSVTDNGITVTLKQQIQDENLIYLLFHVTGEELITEDNSMKLAVNDDSKISGMEWGFVDQIEQPEVTNSRDFEIWMQKDEAFHSDTLSLQFTGYGSSAPKAGPDVIEKEGNWSFTIDTKTNDMKTYDINQTIAIANCELKVSKLEISPLSYRIYMEEDGAKKLAQATGVNLDQLDTLTSLIISGVKYDDDTLISEATQEISAGYQDSSYVSNGKFSEVIDLSQVKSILLGEDQVEVPVK